MEASTSVDEPTVEDEAKKILDQLDAFDEDIRQILVQRLLLLRRLNHIRRIFPDEILYAVFEYACTTDENDRLLLSPSILSAVCFRWRQIVWRSPSLWRALGTIPNRRLLHPSDVELLRLHLRNAGTHFVSLKLHFGSLPSGRTTEELIQTLAELSARIQWLMVSGTNTLDIWTKLTTAVHSCSFDNLHSLSFVGHNPIRPWFPQLSFQTPQLRSVSFDGLYISPRQISLQSVHILHLEKVAIGQCLEVLAQVPVLQEFYCSETVRKERQIILNGDLFTLHHLAVFNADFGPPFKRWETFFFTHFRFPKLRKVVWGTSPLSLAESDTTWRLFFSAMNSVVDFTYQSQEYSREELSGILQALGPSVRRIRVSSPAAQPKWRSVLDAIHMSRGCAPDSNNIRHIELFLPQQNPIFEQNHEEIKERLRGVGLEIDIIGF